MAELRLESSGPFFSGDELGIADCMIFPVLERYRYQLPLMFEDGVQLYDNRLYPALHRWFDLLDSTPSFRERVAGDEYSWTAVTGVMMRFFGDPTPEKEVAAARADAAAARLLAQDAAGELASERARHEAARATLVNHEAIILDATSEAKSQENVPRQANAAAVDAALRLAVSALLRPGSESAVVASDDDIAAAARTVAARLSAPRDMGAEAASALRGALARVASRPMPRSESLTGAVQPQSEPREALPSGSDHRAHSRARSRSEHRRKIYPLISNISPNYVDNEFTYDKLEQ